MEIDELVDVGTAAGMLGLSRQQVHRLIQGGVLDSRSVAGRHLVTRRSVRRAKLSPRAPGRPFSAPTAWTLLRMLSGMNPVATTAGRQNALRQHLLHDDPWLLAARLSHRAVRIEVGLDVEPGMFSADALPYHVPIVPAGATALRCQEDLDAGSAGAAVEAYTTANALEAVTHLRSTSSSPTTQLIARIVDNLARVPQANGKITEPVTALDLLESGSATLTARGLEIWQASLATFRGSHH